MRIIAANGEKNPEEILNFALFQQKYCERLGTQTGIFSPSCLRRHDLQKTLIKRKLADFRSHLRFLHDLLDKKFGKNSEKNPERQKTLALAIFVFAKTKDSVDFADTEILGDAELEPYQKYLDQHGGIGLDAIKEDFAIEGTVADVLAKGRAGSTEKAYTLDYFLREAHLDAGFAEANLSPEDEPNLLLNTVTLASGKILRLDMTYGHVDRKYKNYISLDDYQAQGVYYGELLAELMVHDPASQKTRTILDQALAVEPQNALFHAYEARYNEYHHEPKKREASLKKALDLGPDNIRVLDEAREYGKIYKRLSPLMSLYAHEEDCKRYFPLFAKAAAALKKYKDAKEYFNKSFKLYGENLPISVIDAYGQMLVRKGDSENAVIFYGNWISKKGTPAPRILSLHSVDAVPYEKGFEQKHQAYRDMLAQDPGHWQLWMSYGDFLKERIDDYDGALKAYQKAKKIQMTYSLVERLCSLHETYEKYAEAGRAAAEGLSLYPDRHELYFVYAKNMYKAKRFEEMIPFTKKGHNFLQGDDFFAKEFCFLLLQALVMAAQSLEKQPRRAQIFYEQAVAEGKKHWNQNPEHSAKNKRALGVAYNNLVCIHLGNNALDNARKLFDEGFKLNQKNAHLNWNYSVYLEKIGRTKEAQEYRQRVKHIDEKLYVYLIENNITVYFTESIDDEAP